jgi:hypothetical protein
VQVLRKDIAQEFASPNKRIAETVASVLDKLAPQQERIDSQSDLFLAQAKAKSNALVPLPESSEHSSQLSSSASLHLGREKSVADHAILCEAVKVLESAKQTRSQLTCANKILQNYFCSEQSVDQPIRVKH